MPEPSSDQAEVPLGASDDETRHAILALCTRMLSDWEGVDPGELELTPISGGISNLLVKVTPAAHMRLAPVAVKVFGNKTELLIDREKELQQLLKLNKCGFGAEVCEEMADMLGVFLLHPCVCCAWHLHGGHARLLSRVACALRVGMHCAKSGSLCLACVSRKPGSHREFVLCHRHVMLRSAGAGRFCQWAH